MDNEKTMEQKIIEAAEELFLNQGFDKTTTAQIANLAGCNQAMVHYYYRTKEKLFDQIFSKIFDDMLPVMMGHFINSEPIEIKVKKIIEIHFNFLAKNKKLIPFVYQEILARPERFFGIKDKTEKPRMKMLQSLEHSLKAENTAGKIAKIEAIDLFFTVISLNLGFFMMLAAFQKLEVYQENELCELIETRKAETVRTVLKRLKV